MVVIDMHVMEIFMTLLKSKDAEDYVEQLLACLAAPTIMGLKPGSLVNLHRKGHGGITEVWNEKKDALLGKLGVEAYAFPPRGGLKSEAVLVLLYKRELLIPALLAKEARAILTPLGYDLNPSSVDSWFEHLGKRFEGAFPFESAFPHEIGLFLGYPPEDVRGFIQNRGVGSLATGYWKVYGNVKKAKRAFQKFRRAECDAARAFIRQSSPSVPRV
jgi:hypothetical protein